jgi:hypothetical protein
MRDESGSNLVLRLLLLVHVSLCVGTGYGLSADSPLYLQENNFDRFSDL